MVNTRPAPSETIVDQLGVAAPKPKTTDWPAVERDYRAGMLTYVEMGAIHLISPGRICQVAKSKGWGRDLSVRIKAKADAVLNAAALNTALNNCPENLASERQVIEVNAAVIVHIKTGHRKQLAAWQKIIDEMRVEMASEDLTFMQRAQCIKTLTDALRNLINSERVAYNLDAVPDAKPPEPVIDQMEVAREIAFALARGLH